MTTNLSILFALLLGLHSAMGQPLITQQPQNQTNFVGTSALFSVDATGTTSLSYQWRSYANTTAFTNIPFGTNARLTLTNIQPTTRRFAVVVTAADGSSVTSSPQATLTVVTPPRVSPANPTAGLFADIMLLATNASVAPLAHQWLFNGEPIAGAATNKLVVTNVQRANAGDYELVSTYAFGSATSQVATLKITPFHSMYCFGFSWTDTGGNGCEWPDPPYYRNRACNGPMWPEFVSTNLGMEYVAGNNRALCGATSGDILRQIASLPPSKNWNFSLFFVWEAVGDLLYAAGDAIQSPSGDVPYVHWTNEVGWNNVLQRALLNSSNAVERLYLMGARAIVIQGAFDLGLLPGIRQEFGSNSARFEKLTERTRRFNSQLVATLETIRQSHSDLRLYYVDTFDQLNELHSNFASYGFSKNYPDAVSDPGLVDKSFTGAGMNYLYWDDLHITSKANEHIAGWVLEVFNTSGQEHLNADRQSQTILLRMQHLLTGHDYTLQKSHDLTIWDNTQTFTAHAGTNQVSQPLSADVAPVFYRLQWDR